MRFHPAIVASVFVVLTGSRAQAQTWVVGEMGYRVEVVPEGSPGARHGLRTGDILAEPGRLPARLLESGAQGVEIPLHRLNKATAAYEKSKLTITFLAGEDKRLGLTSGDLGFLVTAVRSGSLGARAELKPGDFVTKINETFVHADNDLKLVDDAYERGEQVLIHFTRWVAEAGEFKTAVSRRRFVK